ncbi:MAG: hypothetical protein IPJ65_18010 [Archangiaceae bacterium]|nr:hypothetical protein [Archangiaceae bacterium]
MTVYGQGEQFNASVDGNALQTTQTGWYNPTWSHNLTLAPEYHFSDYLFTRGRVFISQELTDSDTAMSAHEVEVSDVFLDVGTRGFTEKFTGLRLSGDVRFVLPTSKLSQVRTQWLTVGPSLSLSRRFPVLSGLTLGYAARGTVRFNEYTGGHKKTATLAPCIDSQAALECAEDRATGGRNGFFDLAHGPIVSFQPIETVSIDALMTWQRVWLYPVSAPPAGVEVSLQNPGPSVRDLTRFVLSVNWQFSEPVGVALTALTVGEQLNSFGRYQFPLFNRNTVFYLDATVDIEAVASKLF